MSGCFWERGRLPLRHHAIGKLRRFFRIFAASAVALALAPAALASNGSRAVIGQIAPFSIETPHPYRRVSSRDPVEWRTTVEFPGATYLMLHFVDFDLSPGDELRLLDGHRRVVWIYRGQGRRNLGDFWSIAVVTDRAHLELVAPGNRNRQATTGDERFGFRVIELIHGVSGSLADGRESRRPDSVCGQDDRRPPRCYDDDVFFHSRPVARLIVGTDSCTGWIVSCASDMITNEHCVGSQSEVDQTTALFLDESQDCSGSGNLEPIAVPGDRFSVSNAGLDYSIWSLDSSGEDPAGRFGVLDLDPEPPDPSDSVYIPQHPGGGPKLVAWSDDAGPSGRCQIDPGDSSGEQVSYTCDTSAGSSGSPVLSARSNRVIALHRSGTGGASCDSRARNSGTRADLILRDAGDRAGCPKACPAPAAPSALSISTGCGELELEWSPSLNASGYRVLRSDGECGRTYQVVAEVGEPRFRDRWLPAGNRFAYVVETLSDCGASSPSLCVAELVSGSPGVPVGVSAEAGCSGVELRWAPPAGAAAYEIYRYGGECSAAAPLFLGRTTQLVYADVDAPAGEWLGYSVRATNACGVSVLASCRTARRLPANVDPPANLAASGDCDGIRLSWSASEGASGYEVFRGLTDCRNGSPELLASVTGTFFLDNAALPDRAYSYRVGSKNSCGSIGESDCVTAMRARAPDIPSEPEWVAQCGRVDLFWPAVSGAGSYTIERAPGGCPANRNWSFLASVAGTTFEDVSAAIWDGVSYRVSAVDACGTSDPSACVAVPPTRSCDP